MLQGLREFRADKHTPHADAWGIFLCAALWSLIRIDEANNSKE